MPLPELIEIVPLKGPVQAEITVPGSKSITNRALVLAVLANGITTLKGALWSEDTQVMVEALRTLGFSLEVKPDAAERCNRIIIVQGAGGRIPRTGTKENPIEIFVGNAGTAARFLAALCCLGQGAYRLHGVPRMHERPQAALFEALHELGYRVEPEKENERLPAIIFGGGEILDSRSHGSDKTDSLSAESQSVPKSAPAKGRQRRCTVSIEESSQFASGLMLCAPTSGWEVEVVGENAEESPYVHMTSEMLKVFPHSGGEFEIEPDASSGSYFWAAGWLLLRSGDDRSDDSSTGIYRHETDFLSRLTDRRQLLSLLLRHWPASNWQVDEKFASVLSNSPDSVSRDGQLGDSIMTAIVLAPFSTLPVRFTDLGRLRVQECERVMALRTELTKCGAKVVEEGDTLTVYPSELHGASVETYNDHRMAMCFSILGLKVPGIRIQNPACVKKTFPNFFEKLAGPPPTGLGATILDGQSGKQLEMKDLFAE